MISVSFCFVFGWSCLFVLLFVGHAFVFVFYIYIVF